MSNEEIVIKIQNGDNSLMLQLWGNVYGLVKKYAYRVYTALEGRRGLVVDDYLQVGYLALVDAVNTYKPGAAAFSTWFVIYLRKHLLEAAGMHGKRKINEPIDSACSLDKPLLDGEDVTLEDVVEDPGAASCMQSVEDQIWLDQLREVLGEMMLEMPEKQADVLYRRYWKNQTYTQAGEEIGIAAENIRKNEWKGLCFLREPRNRKRLRPFFYFDCYSGTGLGEFQKSGCSVQERYLLKKEGLF